MNEDFKRVAVRVREPQGHDGAAHHTRVEKRDEIAEDLRQRGVTVVDAPAGSAMMLVECTEAVKQEIKARFPAVIVTDETLSGPPGLQPPKINPPGR